MRLITKADELPQILPIERALVILFHSWSHVSLVNSKNASEAAPRLLWPHFEQGSISEIFQIDVSDGRSELTESVRRWLAGQRVGETVQPGKTWKIHLRNWWSSQSIPAEIVTSGAGTLLWCESGRVRSLHRGGILTPDQIVSRDERVWTRPSA